MMNILEPVDHSAIEVMSQGENIDVHSITTSKLIKDFQLRTLEVKQ